MNGIEKNFTSIQQMADQYLNQKSDFSSDTSEKVSFEEVLRHTRQAKAAVTSDCSGTLKFSKHAAMRLADRKISLSSEQSRRLETGVKRAGEKGIHDSLVILDSLAFIVNVPNKTVVTAMEQSEAEKNIFTNIDGAVII